LEVNDEHVADKSPLLAPHGAGSIFAPCLVTVVVPARNAEHVLAGQLRALSEQEYTGAWEVVVADNGSTDGTAKVARAWMDRLPGLRTVDAAGRRGINHARNVGAAKAQGDLLVFCDADDEADAGWLGAMVAAARTADIVGGFLDQTVLNSRRAASWRLPQPRDRLPEMMNYLPYAVGASLGVRTDVFHALGGFTEDYGGGGDDVELCWRAQLAGHTIAFAADAVMLYRLRERLGPLARQRYGYGRADAQLMKQFRAFGLPPVSAREATWSWLLGVCRLPTLASQGRAGMWVYGMAWRTGRLVGSIRYRVLCL
jgi:glycosyltransferase involved in cell wall biosynthesis